MATNRRPDTPKPAGVPQVGAADPERRNSPALTDPEQSFELLREQLGDESAAGCYFNDAFYPDGSNVRSGSTYLRCERGMWVEVESQAPEVP